MSGPLDQKVKAQSLVDVVAERLEAAIISGALEPGSRLSEQALAASLGVSRGPLREAIRRLEGRKLLERIPNIGVRVAELSLKNLHELLQIREALEGMAAALAAINITDAEVSALRQLLARHGAQKSVQEGTGYYQEAKDFDFHFRIVSCAGNARLTEMLMGDLYHLLRIYRYKSSTKPGRAQQALHEHEAIVEALARRDPAAAETAMREHLRNARAFVREQLRAEAEAQGGGPAKAQASKTRVRSLNRPRTAAAK